MRFLIPARALALICLLLSVAARGAEPSAPSPFELRAGDRVVFLGDRMIEGEQY